MRTLVVSDLHLGSRNDVDVLRLDGASRRLLERLAGIDRLVLLGDVIELRHGPARDALAAAEPVLAAMAAALGGEAEIVIVPGNHDHSIATPWISYTDSELGLEARVPAASASPLGERIAECMGPGRTTVAYPGVWLRDDVYAMHGHYADAHTTLPLAERVVAGLMRHLGAVVPAHGATAEDYERVLSPMYALIGAFVNRAPAEKTAGRGGRAYSMLTKRGPRPLSEWAAAAGFPVALRGLVPLVGPLSPDLSIGSILRSGLVAVSEVVRRMGIDAKHVVFGHTHRTGPLLGDDPGQWTDPSGALLHNAGNWVYETNFMDRPGPDSPYWPGGAILIEDDAAPRLLRLLGDWRPRV